MSAAGAAMHIEEQKKKDKAYAEGRAAFSEGLDIELNPYEDVPKKQAWGQGYADASVGIEKEDMSDEAVWKIIIFMALGFGVFLGAMWLIGK